MSLPINKNVVLITGISLLVTFSGVSILIYSKKSNPETYQNEILPQKYHSKRNNENEVFSPRVTEPVNSIFEEEEIFSEPPEISVQSETDETENESCASVTLTPLPNISSEDVTINLLDVEPDNSQDYEVYEVVTGDGNVPAPESGFDQIQDHFTDRSDLDSSDIEGFLEEKHTQKNEYGLV